MSKEMLNPLLLFLFNFLILSSSGTEVGFSYDARNNKAISSPLETISFLRKNNVSPTQVKVLLTDTRVLNSLSDTGVLVDLFFNESEVGISRKSNTSVISWLETHLVSHLLYVNITSIVVSSSSSTPVSRKALPLLLGTLKSIHSALESLDLNHKVKVSVSFSLSMLESLEKWHAKDVHRVLEFIRKCRSFIMLETEINGALSMGDQFVGLMMKSATTAANLLHYKDVPIVLNVKSSAVPSAIEVAEFGKKMIACLKSHAHITDRISGFFAQICPMEETEQKELNREEEEIFHSSHRELLNNKLITAMKVTVHDNIYPPTTQTNLVPTIVTIPATNPVSIAPVIPATNPVTTTPVTITPTNPVTTPSLVPPLGNQLPPIVTVPMAPPAINNPPAPIGGIPITPPVATPIVNPVSPPAITNPPATAGQTWCIAKTGAMNNALQAALDYACGMGGADCSAIQPSGSCYNPNNAQSHASYAFNSYYQKNPAPSSCDFKGTAVLVNTNPSTGSCIYPSSSPTLMPSPSSFSPPVTTPLSPLSQSPPATMPLYQSPPLTTPLSPPPPATTSSPPSAPTTTTSSGLPPFVLNSSNPDNPTISGSSPPPASSSSVSIATGLQPLFATIILVPVIAAGKLYLPEIGGHLLYMVVVLHSNKSLDHSVCLLAIRDSEQHHN
ncbi:Glucan endo-1,3-beta-glucosidase [Thalictrum thalictroides]|uniref:Glucan endo-1,3-beta-glucosidase n=1 Tax=Thalictrum thalictroides TaxID=46969 RepID=A0A7J6WBW7_THATH|nr:Glucan endo-1,3-beta-glucosidase [Thalictrum thalictroides]